MHAGAPTRRRELRACGSVRCPHDVLRRVLAAMVACCAAGAQFAAADEIRLCGARPSDTYVSPQFIDARAADDGIRSDDDADRPRYLDALHMIQVGGPSQFARQVFDPPGDVLPRRTDNTADAPPDLTGRNLPDLVSYVIGRWSPTDAGADPFLGGYSGTGRFLRFDISLNGLINPPGPAGLIDDATDPTLYGPHPVLGFVEIDMDVNADTGGEFNFPQYRYLGNVGRFGGLPSARPVLALRAARDRRDFCNAATLCPVQRSGEEFHLAFFGDLYEQIIFLNGNNDGLFEAGEVWELRGPILHRAHGYEPFSLAGAGRGVSGGFGVYEPQTRLRFAHLPAQNRTVITLVFPLDNEGAAAMISAVNVEPLDGNAANQASILEALDDLWFSAEFFLQNPTGDPRQTIINQWAAQNPGDYLVPMAWEMTFLFSTSHINTSAGCGAFGGPFLLTDIHPNVIPGDFNANGVVNQFDVALWQNYLSANDGGPADEDGTNNLAVQVPAFACNFSLYDVNYDGVVDGRDLFYVGLPGDIDIDGDVDLADFATLAVCFGQVAGDQDPDCPPRAFARSDLDRNEIVNLVDFSSFAVHFSP